MPILNPKRILTRKGMTALLNALTDDEAGAVFFEVVAKPVLAADISPDDLTINSVTPGTFGLQTAVSMPGTQGTFLSSSGKVYTATDIFSFTVTTPTESQTIVGILISTDGTAANALAYVELEEPVTLDEDGEILALMMEFGFDGQTFYIVPRVMPIGQ